FTDASGTVQAASASHNRYTYTGRELDAGLSLYHFRARMYNAVAGRFISRDPIGFFKGANLYKNYFGIAKLDPSGKRHLTAPATPGKCAEAVFLMQLYSEVYQAATYDKILWNH